MKRKVKIPDTDSIEEMARFWDTHDATDFADEFEELTEPLFEREPGIVIVVRLEPQEAEAVQRIAISRGLNNTALLREWVLEKLIGNQSRKVSEMFEPIKILEVVQEEVGVPRNDGARGSALYSVPFRLSRRPPYEWGELFRQAWDHPPQHTSMHRPGIAQVVDDRIILDGTTLDEVAKYHRDTLVLAVGQANQRYQEYLTEQQRRDKLEEQRLAQHREGVKEQANKIRFD